jgi:methionine-rich copper-binding protein CopC
MRAAAAQCGRVSALLTVLVGCSFFDATPAPAHALVLESVPARDAALARSPERVLLRFNSKIEKRLTRLTLSGGDGQSQILSAGDGADGDQESDRVVVPLPPLPPGRYVIRYKVLSADGHVTEGALRFSLGAGR